jgi:hypothetical protein
MPESLYDINQGTLLGIGRLMSIDVLLCTARVEFNILRLEAHVPLRTALPPPTKSMMTAPGFGCLALSASTYQVLYQILDVGSDVSIDYGRVGAPNVFAKMSIYYESG